MVNKIISVNEITSNSERILWVQSLKAFAIILVVLGHINNPMNGIIYSFHMPLFFFVSGFFLNPENRIVDFIKKNFYRLMIPYFSFGIIGIMMELLKNILANKFFPTILLINQKVNLWDHLLGLIYFMDYEHLRHYGFVLWFLPALFISKSISFFLIKYVRNKYIIFSLLCSFILLFTYSKLLLPFALDKAFVASIFVYSGYLFYNQLIRLKISSTNYFCFTLLLISILLFKFIPSLNIAVSTFEMTSLAYALLVSTTISIIFSKIRYTNNIINTIGGNTIIIFILHPYTNNLAYFSLMYSSYSSWYNIAIISLLLLYLSLILLVPLSKYYSNHVKIFSSRNV